MSIAARAHGQRRCLRSRSRHLEIFPSDRRGTWLCRSRIDAPDRVSQRSALSSNPFPGVVCEQSKGDLWRASTLPQILPPDSDADLTSQASVPRVTARLCANYLSPPSFAGAYQTLRELPHLTTLFSLRQGIGMATCESLSSRPMDSEVLGTSRSTEAEAPPRLRLSTHGLRERDRFEVFRENFRQYLYQAESRTVQKAHSKAASSCSRPEMSASRGSSPRRRTTRERDATSPIPMTR